MKTDRLISIIMLLLEHKKVGAKALADMFEVSPRTIYRDIETINMAGIPIASVPGVNGGFRIMDEYKVDKKIFSTSDIVTLLMGLGSISSMMSGRDIEPYRLVLKDNHWYLQGFCLDRQAFRLFKLSRISELRILDETYEPREQIPSVTEFADSMEERQTIVKLLIHGSIRDKVLDYCSSEHMEPFDDDRFIVRFPFIADDFGYNLILSFGDRCECLEPPEVRAEIIRRVENLMRLYAGQG